MFTLNCILELSSPIFSQFVIIIILHILKSIISRPNQAAENLHMKFAIIANRIEMKLN